MSVNAPEFVSRNGAIQRNVERGVIWADPGTLLYYALAQFLTNGFVKKVSGRVVSRDLVTTSCINSGRGAVLDIYFASRHHADMGDYAICKALRVLNSNRAVARLSNDLACIADLTAGLPIERGITQKDLYFVSFERALTVLSESESALSARPSRHVIRLRRLQYHARLPFRASTRTENRKCREA